MSSGDLFATAAANARKPAFIAALERCAALDAPSASLSRFMALHPRDQMLTHSLAEHRHADIALSQYFAIGIQQYRMLAQVIDACFPGAKDDIRVLDFACGFGRLLRLLRCGFPGMDICASEVQRDALDFCAEQFGVTAIPSAFDPDAFQPGRSFDVIWVASLFSHLPQGLFEGWLRVLLSCLDENGVICFSARAMPAVTAESAAPLLYCVDSENPELGAEHYGTTYVDPDWVRGLVESRFGDGMKMHYMPRALANEQDLYLCSRRTLDALPEKGPWGWLDIRKRNADGLVHLEGWAADLDTLHPARVEIHADGMTTDIVPSIERPDVMAVFGDAGLARCGWRVEQRIEANHVELFSVSAKGQRNLIYAGVIA